jgi:hypothetical protein
MRTLILVGLVLATSCGDVQPVDSSSPLTPSAARGNSDCAQFCSSVFGNTSEAGKCTSDAAHGTGICYECGPKAPPNNGLTLCGQKCVNPKTDPNNCGACGHACAAPTGGTATCTAGGCSSTCPAGDLVCPGGTSGVCTANPNGNFAGATPVAPPSTKNGSIGSPGAADTYSFVAPAALPPGVTRITATETPTSGLIAIVTLYDGSGHPISTSCGATNTVSVVFIPGDQYFVVVGGVGSSTGSYSLSVVFEP